jgi:hypothetical protein
MLIPLPPDSLRRTRLLAEVVVAWRNEAERKRVKREHVQM